MEYEIKTTEGVRIKTQVATGSVHMGPGEEAHVPVLDGSMRLVFHRKDSNDYDARAVGDGTFRIGVPGRVPDVLKNAMREGIPFTAPDGAGYSLLVTCDALSNGPEQPIVVTWYMFRMG